jgi:hypothetical protein
MTSEDCRRIRRELAAEYEAVAEQWGGDQCVDRAAWDEMRFANAL